MFTLKLYEQDGRDSSFHIVEAGKVIVTKLSPQTIRAVCHALDGEFKDAYYIGEPAADTPVATYYAWAVVENASGRTTEVLRPKMRIPECRTERD